MLPPQVTYLGYNLEEENVLWLYSAILPITEKTGVETPGGQLDIAGYGRDLLS